MASLAGEGLEQGGNYGFSYGGSLFLPFFKKFFVKKKEFER